MLRTLRRYNKNICTEKRRKDILYIILPIKVDDKPTKNSKVYCQDIIGIFNTETCKVYKYEIMFKSFL